MIEDEEAAVTAVIDRYRRELVAEAELARSDLDEIEDHLRTLTDDLRAGGMAGAVAVTEAARRLGEPRQLAREHARVGSPFGARLSRTRAFSVIALLVPALVWSAIETVPYTGWWSIFTLELGFGLVLAGAMAARLGWARPILLGGMVFALGQNLTMLPWFPGVAMWMVWQAGMVAFLMPWRRGEVTTAGVGLALEVWPFLAAANVYLFVSTAPDAWALAAAPTIAIAATIAAVCGHVLRARWGAIAAWVASLALVVSAGMVWDLGMRFDHGEVIRVGLLAATVLGAVASAASGLVAWRTARSTLGTLAHVLR